MAVKASVEARLRQCELEAHPEKTRIVYCRDSNRQLDHENIRFDFLGYSFRPREAKSRRGKLFTSFLPAISTKAKQAIVAEMPGVHRKSMTGKRWHLRIMTYKRLIPHLPSVTIVSTFVARACDAKSVSIKMLDCKEFQTARSGRMEWGWVDAA